MAAIDFPTATSNGQTFEADSGVIYTYVGTPPNGFWSGTFGTTGLNTLDGRYITKNDGNTLQIIQTQGLKFNSGSSDTILLDGVNGNVSIGTATPLTSSGFNGVTASGSTGGIYWFAKAGAQKGYIYGQDNDVTLASTDASGVIRLLTGGNNERMRIDSAGNVGIGTASPSSFANFTNLTLQGGTSGSNLDFFNSSGVRKQAIVANVLNGLSIECLDAGAINFSTNGSERARIDSSGRLLVGTSSAPTGGLSQFSRLTVSLNNNAASDGGQLNLAGNARGSLSIGDALGQLLFTDSTNGTYGSIQCQLDGTPGNGDYPGRLVFSVTGDGAAAPTERMRIDSSGRLLLNSGTDVRIELGTTGTTGTNNRNHLRGDGANLKYNCCSGGGHFFEANGGDRMRITSTGKLLVGTAVGSSKLSIAGTVNDVDSEIQITATSVASGYIGANSNGLNLGTDTAGIVFKTGVTGGGSVGGTGTERMRITSAGYVGINISNPTSHLHISGDQEFSWAERRIIHKYDNNYRSGILFSANTRELKLFSTTNDNGGIITFNTRVGTGSSDTNYGSERARIDAAGRFLINNTQNSDAAVVIRTDATVLNAYNLYLDADAQYASAWRFMRFRVTTSKTIIGSIESSNGTSTNYNTTSDYRLKENVVDITDGITRVKQLQPKRFNFIVDPDTTVDGFFAHEAQTVVPESVTGTHNEVEVWKKTDELPEGVSVGDDKLDEDGNTIPVMQGIDQSKLVPLLTAGLQETIAKVETLEAVNHSQFQNTSALLNKPLITFLNSSGATAGEIIHSGVNSVTYATSSDHRLKENVTDLTAAIPRLKNLAPKRFNFIGADEVTVDGFLAHEAQTVVPEAVTGTHNQVDGDGNAVMQGIDQSKLVPLLTAALQEAIAKIETLETKVAALEAAE